jgi:hypothetical protein
MKEYGVQKVRRKKMSGLFDESEMLERLTKK